MDNECEDCQMMFYSDFLNWK